MSIPKEGIEITKRFFLALDTLKNERKIRGIQTFTRAHGINRWNLITVRNTPDRAALKVEYIHYLCKDYHISTHWIIFGTGNFYSQDDTI